MWIEKIFIFIPFTHAFTRSNQQEGVTRNKHNAARKVFSLWKLWNLNQVETLATLRPDLHQTYTLMSCAINQSHKHVSSTREYQAQNSPCVGHWPAHVPLSNPGDLSKAGHDGSLGRSRVAVTGNGHESQPQRPSSFFPYLTFLARRDSTADGGRRGDIKTRPQLWTSHCPGLTLHS